MAEKIYGNLDVLRELKARWFKFQSGNQGELLNISVDPSAVSTDAPKGSLALRDDVASLYVKLDDGDTTNWQKLSDLTTYSTVAAAKAASGSDDKLCFVVENSTFYKYEASGSAYTANDEQYLVTGDGGDTRWIAVAGYKAVPERFEQYAQTIKASGFPLSGSDNESAISFVAGTRTFSLTPSSEEVIWRKEQRYSITAQQDVVIEDVEGLWYIYYGKDATESGSVQLRATQSFTDEMRKREPLVAAIYWDATNGKAIVRDERHSASVPADVRFMEHTNKGSLVVLGGGQVTTNIGDGSLAIHAQISISNHILVDEDIRRAITGYSTAPAQLPMVYLSGTTVRWDTATNVPAKITGGQAYINTVVGGSGSQTAVPDGEFFCTHIISIGGESAKVVAVQGRSKHASANDAYADSRSELISILSEMGDFFEDAVVLATIVLEANRSFASDVRLVDNWIGTTSVDWTSNAFNTVNKANNYVTGDAVPNEIKSNIRDRRSSSVNTTMSFVSDDVLWANSASGDLTITLPTVSAPYNGYTFTIKKTSASNIVTIVGQSSETIDGESSYTILAGNKGAVTVQTDGTEWMVI